MSNAAAFDRVADNGYYLEGEHEYVEHEGYRKGYREGDAKGDAEGDAEDDVAAHFTVQPGSVPETCAFLIRVTRGRCTLTTSASLAPFAPNQVCGFPARTLTKGSLAG